MTTESNHAAGELLKQGRLRQRLSIAECAKRTHIAPRYLEALEEERWETLPSLETKRLDRGLLFRQGTSHRGQ